MTERALRGALSSSREGLDKAQELFHERLDGPLPSLRLLVTFSEQLCCCFRNRLMGKKALSRPSDLGVAIDEDQLVRGRRSFWSGHAAFSFAALTYAALYVGGRMVWGRSATPLTRVIGLFAQGAAMAAAGFITGSRVSDGVHHVDDVLVGSAVGITLTLVSYWLHFDGSGEVRRGISLQAMPTEGGVAAAVSGVF